MTLLQDLIVIFIICMICEKINIISIPVGIGSIMFLPMLFAMVISLVLYLIKGFPFISPAQHAISDVLVVVGISTFIAKVSVVSGVAIPQVIASSRSWATWAPWSSRSRSRFSSGLNGKPSV